MADHVPSPRRIFFLRAITLLCACSLSVGAHYARDTMGPLKSRMRREMGTDNTEFSLLMAAFSLNSTWTPLLGGIVASRLGTSFASIVATSIILLGQLFILIGNYGGSVRTMVFGMFVYGLGVSPLAVIQEAIIIRFFRAHGLGLAMAIGLVAGKFASFVAARTSFPLSERYGPQAPMLVSALLSAFSLLMNVLYISLARWLVQGTGAELEANELHAEARGRAHTLSEAQALHEVAEKRVVHLAEVSKLGDVFWAYIGLNLFCGFIWAPFSQLAANIFQRRYHLTEAEAGIQASYLLAGSVVLYPLCGFALDRFRRPSLALRLFAAASATTLCAFVWLAAPPARTRTPAPAVAAYGAAFGFSPLLLAFVVPALVAPKYVSTTLGAHKSMERTAETLFQTVAGLILDRSAPKAHAAPGRGDEDDGGALQTLLNLFVCANVLHLLSVLALARLQRVRAARQGRALPLPSPSPAGERALLASGSDDEEAEDGDDVAGRQQRRPLLERIGGEPDAAEMDAAPPVPPAEQRRGRLLARAYAVLVVFTWAFFLGTAWARLRARRS